MERSRLGEDGFNPRPRAGGDSKPPCSGEDSEGFNPRPRAGGDVADWSKTKGKPVSIHAPARGATPPVQGPGRHRPVSIHAPARGATKLQVTCTSCGQVSIHAPARGATGKSAVEKTDLFSFNPRPRAGGDTRASGLSGAGVKFQSTPPRGGRHQHCVYLPHYQ